MYQVLAYWIMDPVVFQGIDDVFKLSQGEFHRYIVRLAEDAKLDPNPYPNLIKFTNYITIYEDVDLMELFGEVGEFEDYVRDKISRNDEERALYNLTKALMTLRKLFEATLTNADYDFIRTKKKYFEHVRNMISIVLTITI